MKVRFMLLSMILLYGTFGMAGCHMDLHSLPDDPIVYQTGELYTDTGMAYVTVEYEDKVYIIYGGIKAKGFSRDTSYAMGECLGYIEGDRSDRIYSLINESTDEWLIEYFQGYYIEDLVRSPRVLREFQR